MQVQNVRGRSGLEAKRPGPNRPGAKRPGPKCQGEKRPGPKYQGAKRSGDGTEKHFGPVPIIRPYMNPIHQRVWK